MTDTPPSQEVINQIKTYIYETAVHESTRQPLTKQEVWALSVLTNQALGDAEKVERWQKGLSDRIVDLVQVAYYLGRHEANEAIHDEPDKWRDSGEMRNYD